MKFSVTHKSESQNSWNQQKHNKTQTHFPEGGVTFKQDIVMPNPYHFYNLHK